jgi:MoaA/NifB/PqqE/SkfB family radical SAM enzyme
MPSLPAYLQVEPVGQCNLRCQMCSLQFRQDGPPWGPPAFMAFEVFTRILDEFAGLEHLHLQGLGEPTMHPRFFDMVEYAAHRGIRVTTNSNMTLVNARRAERLVHSGLDTLHASIDAADAETFERIRPGAHFDRVLDNVRGVVSARALSGLSRPELHIVTVLMRQNLDGLPALVRLASDLGADELFVQQLAHDFSEGALPAQYAPMRRFVEDERVTADDSARLELRFSEAREEAARLGLRLRLPRLGGATGPQSHPCDWPWSGAYVSYDGLAMPCCMVATPDRANFGGMAERGVLEVWNGPEYEAFRRALDSDDPPAICSACSIYRGTF